MRCIRHDEIVRRDSVLCVNLPPAPERLFASDNFSGAHPRYLEALSRANSGHVLAYGQDELSLQARRLFQDLCDVPVEMLFTFGGTGANVVALGSLLQPAECVVCTQWSHINVDETGAPEKLLGAKLLDVPSGDGKILPRDIDLAAQVLGNVHHVQPGVVSITQVTELGTVYTVDEIAEICRTAHSYGMRVHLDGARIANAVAALGGTREVFRAMTFGAGVDAVSFGGTKNGMLGAEVVLLSPTASNPRAAYIRKQFTQMPSKQRFIAAQFVEALHDDLWIDTATHANEMAKRLYAALEDISSLSLGPPMANSLYPTIDPAIKERLQAWSFFWDWDLARHQVRWMTSWDTTPEDVDCFAAGIRAALA